MRVDMSLMRPVSPERYTFSPFVKVTTKPFANPRYALMLFEVRFVLSGSAIKAAGTSSDGRREQRRFAHPDLLKPFSKFAWLRFLTRLYTETCAETSFHWSAQPLGSLKHWLEG